MRKTIKLNKLVVSIGAALTAMHISNGWSAAIEEVIVTAQKREENIQTTPIAISAMTSQALENRGVVSFDGIAKASPSITFTPYPTSSNTLMLFMRGQGVSDPGQITHDGSVGLYENGFYIARPQASTFDLADLERVEILRGPQGTLYGRNTTGGAVNLITKDPTGEFGFKQNFTFGTRDQFRSLTTVNLPSWNDIATKFTVVKSSIDGSVKNTGNSHDYGEQEQLGGRFALRWTLSDDVTIDYFMEKGNLDSTPMYYQNTAWNGVLPNYTSTGTPPKRTYRAIDLPLSTSDFEGHGLTVSWDINDSLTLKSLTGYRKLNWDAHQDPADAYSYINTYFTSPVGIPVSSYLRNLVHQHQFSQEFQISGSAFGNTVEYVGGLYYFKEDGSAFLNYTSEIAAIGVASSRDRYVDAEAKSQAGYFQATWTPPILDDRFSITGGARYTKDNRSAERTVFLNGVLYENGSSPTALAPQGAKNDQTFKKFNPSLTLSYNWTEDVSSYLKWTTGYKAGGSSESAPIGAFGTTFSPEKVVSYELGLKSYLFDRQVRLNVALFESKFDDMQLDLSVDPLDASVVQGINAGKATVKGAEFELLYAPLEDLAFNLNYTYLHATVNELDAPAGTLFDPAINPASPYQVGQDIKDTFALPYVPRHSLDFAADWKFLHLDNSDLSAHLDYRFQSSIFNTAQTGPAVPNRNAFAVPSYGVLNARLTWAFQLPRGDHASVSLWGKNIANKQYPAQVIGFGSGIDTQSAVSFTPAGYTSSAIAWADRPSYGIDLSYEY